MTETDFDSDLHHEEYPVKHPASVTVAGVISVAVPVATAGIPGDVIVEDESP